jgi:hypothetical protein
MLAAAAAAAAAWGALVQCWCRSDSCLHVLKSAFLNSINKRI